MLQVFLLTEIFLLFSAAIILSDTYGTHFVSLISIRNFVFSKKNARYIIIAVNCILILGNLFFPVSPGPSIIGDFIPSVFLLVLLCYYIFRCTQDVNFIDVYRKYDALGYVSIGVALIHFLFPSFVIL